MKRSKALTLLALGSLGAAVLWANRDPGRTPAEEFALLEHRISAGMYDQEHALGGLDLALARAQHADDRELEGNVLLARGRLLMELGAYDRAKADLENVLVERPGDRALEELLIEVDARAGDFRAGLARVERLLEEDPSNAAAWVRTGRLHKLAAERVLEQCARAAELALVPDEAEEATRLIERASALDPQDARRVALEHDLRALFGIAHEQQAGDILRSIDVASVDLRASREAFAKSLEISFDPDVLASLLELLRGAGRLEEGVDLATAALRFPATRSDLGTIRFLVRTLGELGRNVYASELAVQWLNANRAAPPGFWTECLPVLHAAGMYDHMIAAARALQGVGNAEQSDVADLYIGLALMGQRGFEGAREFLGRFQRSKTPDPFPNARALVWRELARAARELGDPQEADALVGALEIEPGKSGELWLRLADLQIAAPHGGYRVPETNWAIGMSMLPLRTKELLPRWRAIGDLELKSTGIDRETLEQDVRAGRGSGPGPDPSPYDLFVRAEIALKANDHYAAAEHAEKLLRQVPGFVPGIDLALDVALARARKRDVLDLLLVRLAAVGLDERNRTLLRSIPTELFSPRDLLAVLRADPERSGRLVIAKTLARNGDPEAALAMLDQVGLDELGEEGRALAAELSLSLRRPARALELLEPLESRLATPSPAFALFVDAALQMGAHERLDAVIARVATSEEPERAPWIALADKLLAGGSPRGAEALLRRMERGRPALRGGDLFVRLAASALTRGENGEVEPALERAQAFDTRGASDFIVLLHAVQEKRWEDVKGAITTLRATDFTLSSMQNAALDALLGRYPAAETAIEVAARRDAGDPAWQVTALATRALAGTPFAPDPIVFGAEAQAEAERFLRAVDPRLTLAWIVALGSPYGTGWARAQLDAVKVEDAGALWPRLLDTALARARGDFPRARRLLEGIVAAYPTSKAAWDLLERSLEKTGLDSAERIQIRIRRTVALGDASDVPAQRWLDKALIYQLNGELEQALRSVRKAADLDPSSIAIQAKLGELAARKGDFADSVAAWRKACLGSAPSSNLPATGVFLAVLAEAARAVPAAITPEQWSEELEKLRQRHPDDPRIVVAQAERDLVTEDQNPTLLVARAYARLDRFRAAHEERALENLAPGSVARWTEFHLALDPLRAEAFLERELDLEPGSLSGWALLGRVRAAAGKPEQAVQDLAFAQRLAPSGKVLREYFKVKLAGEWPPDGAEAMAQQILRLETRAEPDPELLALKARAHWHTGPRGAPVAISILEPVFAREDLAPSQRQTIGRDYALALLARGDDVDIARVGDVLAAIEPLTTDPYERQLVRACVGLARAQRAGVVSAAAGTSAPAGPPAAEVATKSPEAAD